MGKQYKKQKGGQYGEQYGEQYIDNNQYGDNIQNSDNEGYLTKATNAFSNALNWFSEKKNDQPVNNTYMGGKKTRRNDRKRKTRRHKKK